ncbi:hypothetical protein ACWDTT_10410 [Streptosporangium sandarakinum]
MNPLDNPQALRHRVVWDAFPHSRARLILQRMGAVPPSDEGAEMACLDSNARVAAVNPLRDHVQAVTDAMASALIADTLGDAADSLDASFVASLVAAHREVLRAGAVVVLAHLLDARMITYPESVR